VGRRFCRRRTGAAVAAELSIRLRILAIGRLRSGPLKELQALYAARLTPPPAIVELEAKQRLPPALLKAREAELILQALPAGAELVALDRRGAAWSSREFAERLAAWRDRAVAELTFAIGGAESLAEPVLERAAVTLSLGAMTWPHFLARGMLLEQLYRAQQILSGHPYHRD
jgi:23S rRNA (pseudouridine1915-N3)-methyltransferase